MELPFYSKYLLIAAYLASYNPAKTDRRFFCKVMSARFRFILFIVKHQVFFVIFLWRHHFWFLTLISTFQKSNKAFGNLRKKNHERVRDFGFHFLWSKESVQFSAPLVCIIFLIFWEEVKKKKEIIFLSQHIIAVKESSCRNVPTNLGMQN